MDRVESQKLSTTIGTMEMDDNLRNFVHFQLFRGISHAFVDAARANDVTKLAEMLAAHPTIIDQPSECVQTCPSFLTMPLSYPSRPFTALLAACDANNLEAARFLIQKGADLDFADSATGCNALDFSIMNGNPDLTSFILLSGNITFKRRFSFLSEADCIFHLACVFGDLSLVQLLFVQFFRKQAGGDMLELQDVENGLEWIKLRSHDKGSDHRNEVVSFLNEAKSIMCRSDAAPQLKGFDVMISYCWANQKDVRLIKEQLESNNVHVWYDENEMKGNIIDCMANAIQNVKTVIVCIGEGYQLSQNCKSEAEYARKLKKNIIFVKVEPDFQPRSGCWLDFIMGSELYYDIRSLDSWIPSLVTLVKDKMQQDGLPVASANKEKEPRARSNGLKPSEWDCSRVQKWLNENVEDVPAKKFKKMNGRCILQLQSYYNQDLPTYRQILNKDLNLSLAQELNFTFALIKLH